TANITSPAGSAANPTIVNTSSPSITWTYTDADHDTQQRYQVSIFTASGTLVSTSGQLPDSTKRQWTVKTELDDQTTYYATVEVFDGYDWSEPSERKFFKIVLNQPPVA